MFRVGQKVVCINISDVESEGLRLKEYTVTGTAMLHNIAYIGVDGMAVEGDPAPWWASRFRALVERKTDISIFTRMLTPKREDA